MSNEGAVDGENKVLSNMEYFNDYYKNRSYRDSTVAQTYSRTVFGKIIYGSYSESTETNDGVFHKYRGENGDIFNFDQEGNIVYYFSNSENLVPLDVGKRDKAYEYALSYCKELYPSSFDLFELTYEEKFHGAFSFQFGILCGDVQIGAVTIGTNQEGEISFFDDQNKNNIEWFLNNGLKDFSKFIDIADKSINERFAENSDYTIKNDAHMLYLEKGKNPFLRSIYVVEGKDILVLVPIKK